MSNLTTTQIEVLYKLSLNTFQVTDTEISIIEKWLQDALNELDTDELASSSAIPPLNLN